MDYRATPAHPTQPRPCQLIMGPHIQTRIPALEKNLLPQCQWPTKKEVQQNDKRAKANYRAYYDRRHAADVTRHDTEEQKTHVQLVPKAASNQLPVCDIPIPMEDDFEPVAATNPTGTPAVQPVGPAGAVADPYVTRTG